jgi:multiple sugar transport system ATP-binding protein
MATVVLNGLKKEYDGGVVAVKDVSVEVKDREFVVLVGPSGCGKSTTLRMIAGLEDISSGTLTIDGKRMNDIPPKDRDIAMVFQNYALYPHMSVYENMAFGLKLRKFPKEEIDQRVHEAAKILSIEEYLNRKPKALSGGQRQRVAVGRAIVRKPKVFLFDEPLSNLDAKMRVQMRTEISKLHQRLNATMIYVTHDQTEAMTMGDRIVVMKDGDVMQIDTPLNLYNHPVNKFVAGFIGSPAMNFIDGTIAASGKMSFTEKGSAFSLPIPKSMQTTLDSYTGKELWLGIRPEHISISDKPKSKVIAKVDVVEPMGNEIFVYVAIGNNQVIARMAPVSAAVGEMKTFDFDMEKALFFDKTTEKIIQSK